ncbi:MAG: hypothetical protein IT416_01855 [Candidatus Pacebacteria bacterium]|nr:hypothetical protein [Candidatus Paceibacterota bacterium]
MVLNLIFFATFTFTLIMIGLAVTKFLNIFLKEKINFLDEQIIDTTIFGLITLTIIIRISYFFSAVNSYFLLIFFVFSLLVYLINKKEINQYFKNKINKIIDKPIDLIILAIVFIYIAYLSATPPNHYDVDLYHANLIRWIENYKIVPGLANLHSRLGFINSWHFLSALSSFSNLISELSLHAMNGWTTLLFVTYSITKVLKNIKANKTSYLDFIRVILVVLTFLINEIRYDIPSPNTDMPISIFTWLIFVMMLEQRKSNQQLRKLNLILFPVFLITIKLSAIPLILISVVNIFSKDITFNIKKIAISTATLLISITVITNIIISGYPLYPFPYLSIQKLEWTLPKSIPIKESAWIRTWAIQPSPSFWSVLDKPANEKITMWIKRLTVFKLSIIISIFVLSFAVIKKIIFEKKELVTSKNTIEVFSISFLGIIFWIFMAPDFRFGYGFLIFFLLSLVLLYLDFDNKNILVSKEFWVLVKKVIVSFLIINLVSSTILNPNNIKEINKRVIFPEKYANCNIKLVVINDLDFFVPINKKENDQTCWNGFPGTPEIYGNFYLLGDKYTDGFAIKNKKL